MEGDFVFPIHLPLTVFSVYNEIIGGCPDTAVFILYIEDLNWKYPAVSLSAG